MWSRTEENFYDNSHVVVEDFSWQFSCVSLFESAVTLSKVALRETVFFKPSDALSLMLDREVVAQVDIRQRIVLTSGRGELRVMPDNSDAMSFSVTDLSISLIPLAQRHRPWVLRSLDIRHHVKFIRVLLGLMRGQGLLSSNSGSVC